jgi:hypothetical protein
VTGIVKVMTGNPQFASPVPTLAGVSRMEEVQRVSRAAPSRDRQRPKLARRVDEVDVRAVRGHRRRRVRRERERVAVSREGAPRFGVQVAVGLEERAGRGVRDGTRGQSERLNGRAPVEVQALPTSQSKPRSPPRSQGIPQNSPGRAAMTPEMLGPLTTTAVPAPPSAVIGIEIAPAVVTGGSPATTDRLVPSAGSCRPED